MAVTITRQNAQKEIEQETLPILLEVFAPWCGPCQQMGPIFEVIEKDYQGKLKCAKLNVDEERELSIDYEISSVPTFLFIKNNKVQERLVGGMSKERLKEAIDAFLK
jgi:thioredoxin 1